MKNRYRRTKEQIESGEGQAWFDLCKRFNQTRGTANFRGILWELTLDQYEAILAYPCIYGGKGLAEGIRVNLDRVENSQGYTLTNVVPCCWFHNYQRSCNWTHAAFLDIMAHYPTRCRNRSSKGDKDLQAAIDRTKLALESMS